MRAADACRARWRSTIMLDGCRIGVPDLPPPHHQHHGAACAQARGATQSSLETSTRLGRRHDPSWSPPRYAKAQQTPRSKKCDEGAELPQSHDDRSRTSGSAGPHGKCTSQSRHKLFSAAAEPHASSHDRRPAQLNHSRTCAVQESFAPLEMQGTIPLAQNGKDGLELECVECRGAERVDDKSLIIDQVKRGCQATVDACAATRAWCEVRAVERDVCDANRSRGCQGLCSTRPIVILKMFNSGTKALTHRRMKGIEQLFPRGP